ncbi:MAG: glycosyltransferase family 4 protein [Acidobacteriota bacterium]|nr:glycosyltransferase family 4 protein [Acidobacteriota bacterium]
MRITFLCQYFPPEMGAPSARTFEHARRWAELGHEVTVVTGFPNHPTGIIRPEYRGQFVKREQVAGINLLRTWVYCAANKGFFRRVLNFFSFFFSSLILGTFMTGRPDVVIGTSPQFFCAVSAYLLSRVKRVPFVFEVRDIWPQSAVEMGALKNRWLIAALEAIEMHLYRHAALIVPVAESTREYLLAKGIAPEKIEIITNGIDAGYLASASVAPEEVRRQFGLEGKFVVSYIGTHGMAHALNFVLEAAKRFDQSSGVHFLFVGEGAEKENLKQLAEQLSLTNLTFLDEQPRERLLGFYRASDVSLVPLRKLEIFRKVLPSKLFELMGVGCPIICSVEGEAARLVTAAEAGLCIEPENADALFAAINRLRAEPKLRKQMGANGQQFVKANYLRSVLAEKYLNVVSQVAGCRLQVAGGVPHSATCFQNQPPTTNHQPPTTNQ